MRFAKSILAVLATSVLFTVGCAAEVGEATGEDIDTASDELRAPSALAGAWHGASGAIQGIVFDDATVPFGIGSFFADVDTGIRCVRAPCPSTARITGSYRITGNTVRLTSQNARPEARPFLGTYRFTVRRDQLVLSKDGKAYSLTRAPSYCAAPVDCESQNLIRPLCIGQWSCTAESTCAFQCGEPQPRPCADLDEATCSTTTGCKPVYGPSYCSPDGRICTMDIRFKGCIEDTTPVDCTSLDEAACRENDRCQPVYGPSHCSPDGRICTRDIRFKGCKDKEPEPRVKCFSSDSCDAGEYCTTETGDCLPSGMLQVCSGYCVPGPRRAAN
jgi:hypothetical protein